MKFPLQRGFRESKEFDPHAQLIQFKYGITYTKTLRIRIDKSDFVGGDKCSIKTGLKGSLRRTTELERSSPKGTEPQVTGSSMVLSCFSLSAQLR